MATDEGDNGRQGFLAAERDVVCELLRKWDDPVEVSRHLYELLTRQQAAAGG